MCHWWRPDQFEDQFEEALNAYEAENDGIDQVRGELDDLAACRQLLAEIRDLIARNVPAGVERPPSSLPPDPLAELAAVHQRVADQLRNRLHKYRQ